MTFETELEALINRYSKESESDTPDFLLANFLLRCLSAFNNTVAQREAWYGRREYKVVEAESAPTVAEKYR